jgi:oxidase EvaA
VTPVPLDELDGWHFDPATGNLGHRSGGFFTVEGIEASLGEDVGSWTQPIIIQDEIGMLGILVKRFGGVPYCLMQAKMEPGNVNTLQLSPTVQATRSNHTRVHRGSGARARQLPLGEPRAAEGAAADRQRRQHRLPDRAVGAALPARRRTGPGPAGTAHGGGHPQLVHRGAQQSRTGAAADPAEPGQGLEPGPGADRARAGAFFTVLGVDVEASSREVARWSQPLLAPVDRGVVAFLARRGGPDVDWQLLVHAQSEAGTSDVVEMSPTVNCVPQNYAHLPERQRPPFLDAVLSAPPSRIHVDTVLSEEGGRFHHAENRYLLVEVPDDFPADVPEDHIWMTRRQLTGFVRYGNHVNVVARSLLACLMD